MPPTLILQRLDDLRVADGAICPRTRVAALPPSRVHGGGRRPALAGEPPRAPRTRPAGRVACRLAQATAPASHQPGLRRPSVAALAGRDAAHCPPAFGTRHSRRQQPAPSRGEAGDETRRHGRQGRPRGRGADEGPRRQNRSAPRLVPRAAAARHPRPAGQTAPAGRGGRGRDALCAARSRTVAPCFDHRTARAQSSPTTSGGGLRVHGVLARRPQMAVPRRTEGAAPGNPRQMLAPRDDSLKTAVVI